MVCVQENGLVPIVEPEVTLGPGGPCCSCAGLLDAQVSCADLLHCVVTGDYSIEETAYWSERVYSHVFRSSPFAVSAFQQTFHAMWSEAAVPAASGHLLSTLWLAGCSMSTTLTWRASS